MTDKQHHTESDLDKNIVEIRDKFWVWKKLIGGFLGKYASWIGQMEKVDYG